MTPTATTPTAMTVEFRPIPSLDPLAPLRRRYVERATAPLDGMWLCGLAPAAAHVGLVLNEVLAGYYCLNDDGFLLQFHVDEALRPRAIELFKTVASQDEVRGAFASTAEPEYLSLCMDHFPRVEVNALLYQHHGPPPASPPLGLIRLGATELGEAVDFASEAIGAPKAWLHGYYEGLISRQELFALRIQDVLVGLGESRGFAGLQPGYADLGVIVGQKHRGQGLATQVLRDLVRTNEHRGVRSICSTEVTNAAAQTAIRRAGFVAHNRIVQLHAS
ncbi:MAG: GNAT family N-acetyltransferase [Nannocystales bacterium]